MHDLIWHAKASHETDTVSPVSKIDRAVNLHATRQAAVLDSLSLAQNNQVWCFACWKSVHQAIAMSSSKELLCMPRSPIWQSLPLHPITLPGNPLNAERDLRLT